MNLIQRTTERFAEADAVLSDSYRYRVLTYGPDPTRLLLRSFDDLALLLDDLSQPPEGE